MSHTRRRRPYNHDWQERGDKRFVEQITCHADKWHSPQCVMCGNSDAQRRAVKRGNKQRAMEQELRDSD